MRGFRGRTWEHLGTAALALVLSLIVWVSAIYQNDAPRQDYFPEPIPIEVLNMPAGMAITNTPSTEVRGNIKAFQSSWEKLARQNLRATADFAGLGEGLHTVPIEVTCSDRTVTVLGAQPDTLYVQLEQVKQVEVQVELQLEGQEQLPLGYTLGTPVIDPSTVTIEGPASLVDSVSAVVATVPVAGRRDSVDSMFTLKAYDAGVREVRGVKITPNALHVQMDIQQRFNYREVAVLARTTGQPARGYYVSSVQVQPATVTVVGPPTVIATMPGLVSTREPIDVTGATRLLVERADLALPDGVSVYSENSAQDAPQILVTVDIDAVVGGTTVEVPLKARRLREGHSVVLSVPTVDVILQGPSVVLDDLSIELVDAYVDLSGLEPGTHQLRVVVELMVAQNPALADLVATSISPAYVEADLRGPGTPTPGSQSMGPAHPEGAEHPGGAAVTILPAASATGRSPTALGASTRGVGDSVSGTRPAFETAPRWMRKEQA